MGRNARLACHHGDQRVTAERPGTADEPRRTVRCDRCRRPVPAGGVPLKPQVPPRHGHVLAGGVIGDRSDVAGQPADDEVGAVGQVPKHAVTALVVHVGHRWYGVGVAVQR